MVSTSTTAATSRNRRRMARCYVVRDRRESRPTMATLLEELVDWLRIPSVSTGGGDADALRRACDWVCERIEAAGGTAASVALDGGNPMAVGELPAARSGAPTVLAYGHYDVQ